jgi:DNA-binding response OmpR family regulator
VYESYAPGCSGIDLCKKLREFDPSTPILFYSGAAYESDKQQAFAAGAQGYLVKPVDNDELIEQVSRLISAARDATQSSDVSVALIGFSSDVASKTPCSSRLRRSSFLMKSILRNA